MHPIFASRLRLSLYLVAWICLGAQLAALLQVTAPRPFSIALLHGLPMALLYAFMCLSAWWVCRASPLGKTPPTRVLTMLLGSAAVASLVWAGLAGVWARVAVTRLMSLGLPLALPEASLTLPEAEVRARDFALFVTAGVPLYLISAAVHYLIIAFEASRAAERRALESQVVAREAELRALRAQLNPHFLFNSLNSINALVGSDPEGARRMCERLGDFFRRTLALAAHESVPLGEEVALVERYLAIEQVRFGERLTCRVEVTEEAARCGVPPLLLQPLVENAVKHGVSERLEGGEIRITGERVAGNLRVMVENPCDDEPSAKRGQGVGLENVRSRLRAMEGKNAQLDAIRDPGVFRVRLVLPAVPAGAGSGAVGDASTAPATAVAGSGAARA